MIHPCDKSCVNKTASGYCATTACINPLYSNIGTAQYGQGVQKRITTNADRILDKECVVRETIDNLRGTGAVAVDGKVWTARMLNEDETAREGEIVIARRIDGVKLIVERA